MIRYDPDICDDDDPNRPAICDDEYFDEDNVDPALMSIIELYDKSLYCDECFLKIWRQRLVSPFLTVSNWTQFRVEQFDALQSACSTSMPYATLQPTLFLSSAANPTPTASDATTTGVAATATCTGRVIQPSVAPQYCNNLADMYNVSSGELKAITKNDGCEFTGAICLPPPCVSFHTKTAYFY